MKKSRAIDLLDNLIGMIEDNQDNDYDTAFRMAIEALKTQLSQEGTTSDQHVATDTNVGNNSEIPNSSDCISRQKAIDAVDSETVSTNPEHFKSSEKFIKFMDDDDIASFGRWQWANGFNTALTATTIQLKKLPPAQPEPKEGHWIEGGIYRDVIECYCSECGQIMTTVATVRMNYCPRCGADMRGEQHG